MQCFWLLWMGAFWLRRLQTNLCFVWLFSKDSGCRVLNIWFYFRPAVIESIVPFCSMRSWFLLIRWLNCWHLSLSLVFVTFILGLHCCLVLKSFLGVSLNFLQTKVWSVSHFALWKARVWLTSGRSCHLVIMWSSWCQWPEQGCCHETFRWCLSARKVPVMHSWNWAQSSSKRWPFSFTFRVPCLPRHECHAESSEPTRALKSPYLNAKINFLIWNVKSTFMPNRKLNF